MNKAIVWFKIFIHGNYSYTMYFFKFKYQIVSNVVLNTSYKNYLFLTMDLILLKFNYKLYPSTGEVL